jgi:hypothetical protein
MAAHYSDIEVENPAVVAAASSLASDAIIGQPICGLLGCDERALTSLMAETVLAWRDYLDQLTGEGGEGGEEG